MSLRAHYTEVIDALMPWLQHQYLSVAAVNKHVRAAYRATHAPITSLNYACASEQTLEWSLTCTATGLRKGMMWHFALAAARLDDLPALLRCCCDPENLPDWSRRLSHEAAQAGSISILDYLVSKDELCPFTICPEAINHRNLPLLQWAHEHGCGLFGNTCLLAASAGDLPIMQWLREQRVAWDYDKTVEAAAASANPASWWLLNWLQQENAGGALWSQDKLQQLLYNALLTGNTVTADWLLAQGAPLPEQLWHTNVYVGPVVCSIAGLQWARSNGCGWDRCGSWGFVCEFVSDIADIGFAEPVAEGTPWCLVAHRNSRAAVEWAHTHGCCNDSCEVSRSLRPPVDNSQYEAEACRLRALDFTALFAVESASAGIDEYDADAEQACALQ
jgi:hypothetical protein